MNLFTIISELLNLFVLTGDKYLTELHWLWSQADWNTSSRTLRLAPTNSIMSSLCLINA